MKQFRLLLVVCCWVAGFAFIQAQTNPNELIRFEEPKYNFGSIKEEGGPAVHEFKFTNVTPYPVKLVNVKASCGCTTPKWSQEVIPPGGSGIVTASYDPMNRPGGFNKSVTVQAQYDSSALKINRPAPAPEPAKPLADEKAPAGKKKDNKKKAENTTVTTTPAVTPQPVNPGLDSLPPQPHTVYLTIEGNVIPRVKGPKDFYPHKVGNLRFSTANFYFDTIRTNAKKELRMVIYNENSTPITIKSLNSPSKAISFEFSSPEKIVKPNDSLILKCIFDGKLVTPNDYDFFYTQTDLVTDDSQEPSKKIYITGNVFEYFPPMTKADSLSAPRVAWNRTEHDFGTITQGEIINTEFVLTNMGKKDLVIRKSKASCGCTAGNPDKMVLKPGEKTTIKASFNSTGKNSTQHQTITIITNDPFQPKSTLSIKGTVNAPATPAPAPNNGGK